MEMQQLNEWIDKPELMGEESLTELRSLISRYPYFQTAWLLYLKNLHILNSPSFKEELRRGALYVTDLSVLFYFVEGNKYSIERRNDEMSDTLPSRDRTLVLIDRFLSEIPNDKGIDSELSMPVDSVTDYPSLLLMDSPSDKEECENVSPLKGQELIDNFIEKSESGKLADNKEDTVSECLNVDEFFEETDEMYDYNDNECGSVSEPHTDDIESVECREDAYLTETLAKIYVKQQRYDKALGIIKKLNLKNPEKNIYFADQIRHLERLIINAKSK